MNSIFIQDSHVAAYNLSHRIENFVTLTLVALSSSQVTILSMFYGAKRFDLIKSMVRYTTMWAILISSFFSIIIYFFIEDIAPLFLTASSLKEIAMSEKAIKTTIDYYKVMIFIYPFIGITMVSTRAMLAIGKAWPTMVITLLRVIVLQCTLTYIFISIMNKDIYWAWYGIGASIMMSALISYSMRLYFFNRLYKNIER